MKKRLYFSLFIVIIGILVYGNWFYGVKFVGDHSIGGVIKTKDEKLEAYVFCHIRNGCFTEKEITFKILPEKDYEISALKEEQYTVVEIYIESGKAMVSSDKMTITIPAGEEVRLRIHGEGTYIGSTYKGEAVTIRRAAPETRIVVIH